MVKEKNKMTIQNYLVVENNIVTNVVIWDGNTNTWQPPSNATMLIQATTPALIWQSDNLIPPAWILVEVMGVGNIGFTWNNTVLTTNQPKPIKPPVTSGTQLA
jgi:hypothetical protein